MKRPSRSDAKAFAQAISDWTGLDEFRQVLDEFVQRHGGYARGDRNGKLWREAYHCVRFAEAVDATMVRTGDDPPDFEFLINGDITLVELVVVRDTADMTCEDFIDQASFIGPRPIEHIGQVDLQSSWDDLPVRIGREVAKKAAKPYPRSYNLAVAATSWWWEDDGVDMQQAIVNACKPYLSQFCSIWVLAGSHFIRI